jgi:hypothetical protein
MTNITNAFHRRGLFTLLSVICLCSVAACDTDDDTDHESQALEVGDELEIDLDLDEAVTATPDMKLTFEGPANGTELVRSLTGSNPPATIEVRFDPATPTETLSGLPSGWCNTPSAGQPLIYDVPVTVSGITTDNLEVTKSPSGVRIQVPIKIKHNL